MHEELNQRRSKSAVVVGAVRVLRQAGWKTGNIRHWLAENPVARFHISEQQIRRAEAVVAKSKSGLADALEAEARKAEAQPDRRMSRLDVHWPDAERMLREGATAKKIWRDIAARFTKESAPTYKTVLSWVKRREKQIGQAGAVRRPAQALAERRASGSLLNLSENARRYWK